MTEHQQFQPISKRRIAVSVGLAIAACIIVFLWPDHSSAQTGSTCADQTTNQGVGATSSRARVTKNLKYLKGSVTVDGHVSGACPAVTKAYVTVQRWRPGWKRWRTRSVWLNHAMPISFRNGYNDTGQPFSAKVKIALKPTWRPGDRIRFILRVEAFRYGDNTPVPGSAPVRSKIVLK